RRPCCSWRAQPSGFGLSAVLTGGHPSPPSAPPAPHAMNTARSLAVLCLLTAAIPAQDQVPLPRDRITLDNGDVLTGEGKTMAGGKVTFVSPVLGEIVAPMSTIGDMAKRSSVTLETKPGDRLVRRIVGIEAGNLRLEGDTTSLALANLD